MFGVGEEERKFQGKGNIFEDVKPRSFWKPRWETGNSGKKGREKEPDNERP